jgi:diguanylate cyclase
MDASSPFPTRVGRWHPVLWTVFGPLTCTVIAVGLNSHLFAGLDPLVYERAMASALILPLCVGTPIFFFFSLKLRELAVVNHRLGILAATDGLTACLNRNAFAAQVDLRVSTDKRSGALLIVDADKFKLINDRYGHQTGDRALELIAETLRATVRAGDIVGRLGGEEFGIFLPNISPVSAGRVAERLRVAVADTGFIAEGKRHPLSVSIGGVVFDDEASFEALFQQADDRLYYAKQTGRNKVVMASFELAEAAG